MTPAGLTVVQGLSDKFSPTEKNPCFLWSEVQTDRMDQRQHKGYKKCQT